MSLKDKIAAAIVGGKECRKRGFLANTPEEKARHKKAESSARSIIEKIPDKCEQAAIEGRGFAVVHRVAEGNFEERQNQFKGWAKDTAFGLAAHYLCNILTQEGVEHSIDWGSDSGGIRSWVDVRIKID